jgi:peptidoglycan/xylan/chitin deacetylase (PgdA/CDA1 family)
LANEIGAPREGTEDMVEWMKALPIPDRQRTEQAIRTATVLFQKSPEQSIRYDLMSWSDIACLDKNLISIGSHTLSHPILSTLKDDELEFEIAESRTQLQARLGTEVPHFCYPNGSHNPAVVASVRRHYDAAVTTEPGFVEINLDSHLLPRIPWAPSVPLLSWRLWRPSA